MMTREKCASLARHRPRRATPPRGLRPRRGCDIGAAGAAGAAGAPVRAQRRFICVPLARDASLPTGWRSTARLGARAAVGGGRRLWLGPGPGALERAEDWAGRERAPSERLEIARRPRRGADHRRGRLSAPCDAGPSQRWPRYPVNARHARTPARLRNCAL